MSDKQDIKCSPQNKLATLNGEDDKQYSASRAVLTDMELGNNNKTNKQKAPNDLLSIKATDTNGMARVKLFLQYFCSWVSYAQIAFFAFITLVLVAISVRAA